jgi:hypothetical protein
MTDLTFTHPICSVRCERPYTLSSRLETAILIGPSIHSRWWYSMEIGDAVSIGTRGDLTIQLRGRDHRLVMSHPASPLRPGGLTPETELLTPDGLCSAEDLCNTDRVYALERPAGSSNPNALSRRNQ